MRINSTRQELLLRVQAKMMEAKSLLEANLRRTDADDILENEITDTLITAGQALADAGCTLDYNPYFQTRY